MTTTFEFNLGAGAPFNQNASVGLDWCYVCGRKLGKSALHFEVDNGWMLIAPQQNNPESQGCFPVGKECAKKFAPNLLITMKAGA